MRITGSISLACLLYAFVAPGPARALEYYPLVAAVVRPEKASVGSRLEYVLRVSGERLDDIEIVPPDAREFIPPPRMGPGAAPPASAAVPLYVIQSVERKEESHEGKRSVSLIMGIVYYRAGRHPLPAIEIRGADGIEIGYKIPEVQIEARNPAGEFQEIEPPLELGGNYYRLFALAAVMGLLAAGGYLLFRRQEGRRTKAAIPATPETPPLDEFLASMQAIRLRIRTQEVDAGEYVLEASRLFRVYLSRLIGINGMEMTSLELAASLEGRLGEAARSRLRDDFDRVTGLWDIAKFAEFAPSASSLGENLELAMELGRRIAREARRAGL